MLLITWAEFGEAVVVASPAPLRKSEGKDPAGHAFHLFALKQADAGQGVPDVCRQMGISEATYYVWKKRYANMGLLEVRELRQLRDKNARLKRLVADLTLDRHVLQEVIKKKI